MVYPKAGTFAEPGILILASLAEGPKHGYAIIVDVRQMTGIKLGPGTLYGAISRLEGRGLIEPLPSKDRRKPYRLTALGLRVLGEYLESLHSFAKQGLGRLRRGPSKMADPSLS